MQEKNNKLLVIAAICLMLSTGCIIGSKIGKSISSSEIATEDVPSTPSPSKIVDISVNTNSSIKQEYIINKQTKYSDCEHILTSEDVIIAEDIDDVLEEVPNDFKVISKGTNGVVAEKKVEGYCPEHYLITEKSGKVIIYRLISKDEKEVFNFTDIPINILRDDIKKDLEEGIKVYTSEKLNEILQELES